MLECLAPDAVRLVGNDQVGALADQVLAGLVEHLGRLPGLGKTIHDRSQPHVTEIGMV